MAKIDLSRIMLAAAVTVTAPGMMAGARADQDDTVSVVAAYALRHEDNLFRLPPGPTPAPPPANPHGPTPSTRPRSDCG